ncbi:MAG: hypothetical protein QOJ97_241 [Solirubrobacteraceae bacterium]|jgi:hypothetical protein|nr:hypothetical protein [Solirubrobacteraceae bacterium]
MSQGRVSVFARRALLVRWAARAPRVGLGVAVGLLAAGGLRVVVSGAQAPTAIPRPLVADGRGQLRVAGFAEAFARVYMTRGRDSAQRERSLGAYVSAHLDGQIAAAPMSSDSQAVTWSAVVDYSAPRARQALVTVALQRAGASTLDYLSVPVAWTAAGELAVNDYPGFVGAPAHSPDIQSADGEPVADGDLAVVVRRALGNYLAGARDDLQADLDHAASLTVPTTPLHLQSVDALAWLAPGRVAATVSARAGATTYTLRYELVVVHRDRWYVRAVNDPTQPGGQ